MLSTSSTLYNCSSFILTSKSFVYCSCVSKCAVLCSHAGHTPSFALTKLDSNSSNLISLRFIEVVIRVSSDLYVSNLVCFSVISEIFLCESNSILISVSCSKSKLDCKAATLSSLFLFHALLLLSMSLMFCSTRLLAFVTACILNSSSFMLSLVCFNNSLSTSAF